MYAPVVNWISVCTLLAITKIHKIGLKSIDFVMEFLQAELDANVYIELTIGIDHLDVVQKVYILNINKSINRLK